MISKVRIRKEIQTSEFELPQSDFSLHRHCRFNMRMRIVIL